MFDEQVIQPNPYLEALKDHWKGALRAFAAVLLLAAAGAYFTRQYSASAVLALNPQAFPESDADPKADSTEPSTVALAWSALSDRQIAAIIAQFQLDHGMAHLRARGQFFTYMRSKIFIGITPEAAQGAAQGLESPSAPALSMHQVEISFIGESPDSAMGVVNAIAQQMSHAQISAAALATGSIAAPNSQLEKSRLRLKMLSEMSVPDTAALRGQVEQDLIKDANLRAQRSDAAAKLEALASASARLNEATHPAPVPVPVADPARASLETQIRSARSSLASLRQRYTELYPDVQQAEANVNSLEARLSRLPQSPRPTVRPAPQTAELASLATQQNELRMLVANLDDQIVSNQNAAEMLRQKIAAGNQRVQEYTAEQQRYSTLLQVQEALDEGDSSNKSAPRSTPGTPMFMIVKTATTTDASGAAFSILFWLLSFAGALAAAALAIFVAEQFAPAVHERAPVRSFHPR